MGREEVLIVACLVSGLAFGLMNPLEVVLGVVFPSGVYWHNLFKVYLPGWKWSVIAALSFIPLIPSAYFTEGKKTDIIFAFFVSSMIGSIVYFVICLPPCAYVLLLILGSAVYVKATCFSAKNEKKVEG